MTEYNGIGRNGSPTGHRLPQGMTPKTMPQIPVSARDAIREQLSGVMEEWCRRVCDGVRDGERTAMHIWPRAMGVIGAEVEINVNLACVSAFGIAADDVRQIIEAHRQSSATSIEQCAEDGIALLRWCLEQEPQRRAAILAALGGTDAPLAIAAPADGETNGDANGHGTGAA